jgi:hypothetical protein
VSAILLTLRFVLELALLVAFAVGGWNLTDPAWAQVALAALMPVAAASVWGLLLSPKARFTAPLPVRIVIELALFGAASTLLWVAGLPAVGVVLLVAELVVVVALIAKGTPPGSTSTVSNP